jgi:glycosyltransferase involved in cell wall biosynthesis
MENCKKPKLFFWFDQPPKVSKGAFNYLSKVWGNKVSYICVHDFDEIRKLAKWNDGDFGNADVIILENYEQPDEIAFSIIDNNKESIHVFNGFRSKTLKYFKYLSCVASQPKIVMFAERPTIYGCKMYKFFKSIVNFYIYAYFVLRYQDKISAFCPLGQIGCKEYLKYGWDKSKMFPFMYCPPIDIKHAEKKILINDYVKFLYVGRFSAKTKGLDVLMRAIEMIDQSVQFRFDFVGGYGNLKEKLIEWIKKNIRINYLGIWPSTEMVERMQKYDVVVVPSRFDGWNLLTNESIMAGLGTIVTDQAVSHELIYESKSGLVVKAGNAAELKNAIEFAAKNPKLVANWKNLALEYANKISPETVGKYFIKIIEYACLSSKERPACPWIEEKND